MTTTIEQRRIEASVAACANIPLEVLEHEKCIVERMMDSIAAGASKAKVQEVPSEEVERLKAEAAKHFAQWQAGLETINRLKAEKKALEGQVERLERRAK